LVNPVEAGQALLFLASYPPRQKEEVRAMYVVVQHHIKNAETAFPRGQRLISGEGAPEGVKVLQFYPSQDLTEVTCLWEADSVAAVQNRVDTVLGDASENFCYPVASEQAFADHPLGLPATPMLNA
jgi:hypothetical protein